MKYRLKRLLMMGLAASLLTFNLNACSNSGGSADSTSYDTSVSDEEMIENLTLSYNRARQGSITQELTEIIAGAEALA